ncbi:MAG: glutamate synthase central domain-containing protein, partial [Parasphingopyxis sp.]
MYRPEFESDACGVGLVAAIDGTPSRRVVEAGIGALRSVWHRGAVDADGKTGDGAGILVDLPERFFDDAIEASGHEVLPNRLAVGMVFLPRTDLGAQETCRTIVESEIIDFGYRIYGWRQVPVDIAVIGDKAQLTRPEIEQIMIAGPLPDEADAGEFEKDLYLIRKRIEKRIVAAQVRDFYICSLSCRSVVYKGLFLAESLAEFYPDLNDARFESRVAIFHQRYSTNTFPQWWLAQPFRALAHNGEINTIRGNRNWMQSHEIKMASLAFGAHSEEIKPLIPAGASDTASLDAVFEAICRSGRDAPTAKLMLIPESWQQDPDMPEAHRDMYAYLASMMEPWDGPAAMAASDGRWAIAGLDRNALRPLRTMQTADGLLIVGSETGMVVVPESEIVAKGQLGPGQMIGVDLEEGRLYEDRALKDRIAGERPYGEWVKTFRTGEDLPAPEADHTPRWERAELIRRQVAAGQTIEDMELILAPMIESAKEAVGSMGDDTPLAVVSLNPRLISHFFRQNFSQVTNPAIDSLRESHVMSLNTRFNNLANILDDEAEQSGVLVLDSPILSSRGWGALFEFFGENAAAIDCTFEAGASLREAIARVRREAEQAVREGRIELFLSDEAAGPDRIAIPMVLAAAAVHTHLKHKGLRSYASVNVRSAECLDTHYFAVLIGVGATTVNAWLAEAAVADRHARGLCGDLSLEDSLANYQVAIEEGLKKIMSKMGIAVISSYRGGYNFEAVGLSRALVDEFFPGMPAKISGEGYASLELNANVRHQAAWD